MVFERQDFDVFNAKSLDERMAKIRTIIDPKFVELSDKLLAILNHNDQSWFAHVAKHLRRTTNAPDNTWVALAPNKRGYKMLPHYEIGLWEDHVYFYLAVEENMKPSQTADIVSRLRKASDLIATLPKQFVLSTDHMVNHNELLTPTNYDQAVTRFEQVKHSEVLIGIVIDKQKYQNDAYDDEQVILTAFEQLHDLYKVLAH